MENYNEFQNIADILIEMKSFLNEDSNMVWSGFENAIDFMNELDKDINLIRKGDIETLKRIYINFAPTSTYQEISLSNGWGKEYLRLSSIFDKNYEIIVSKKSKSTSILVRIKSIFNI